MQLRMPQVFGAVIWQREMNSCELVLDDSWFESYLQFFLLLLLKLYAFSFQSVACLNRSEQALECEETAVASVSTAGPSDEAAAPGISKFHVFVCNLQLVVV
jgi:hypothetical protein